MTTVERFHTSISELPGSSPTVDPLADHDNAIALRLRAAGSSFFWAMQLLPYRRREAMYALYAFCCEVDDIADGDATRELKGILLSDWRSEIALLYAGRPQHVVTRALGQAVRRYRLQCRDFLAIIDGMAMDAQANIRAPSLEELDLYCQRVAVAVGRLSVRIFGEETAAGERVAAELGRALQLTNILCDLAEDARRQRLYLPREVLRAHGIYATTPSWVLAHPALPDVCRDVAMLAEKHYAAATEAIAACPHRTMRPAAVILHVYRTLLRELLVRGWRHLDEPVRVPAWRKLTLLFRHGLAGRWRDAVLVCPPTENGNTALAGIPAVRRFAACDPNPVCRRPSLPLPDAGLHDLGTVTQRGPGRGYGGRSADHCCSDRPGHPWCARGLPGFVAGWWRSGAAADGALDVEPR
jgi:presqualene diphosphate synthase